MQPESDLDRTDELPQLDVVAYESSLSRGRADPNATTDAWLAESLQQADDDVDSTAVRFQNAAFRSFASNGADLSNSINRLQQRIRTLESEAAALHASNAELEKLRQSLSTERDAFEARVGVLSTDNARLTEQRLLGQELTQRLQAQLQQQAAQHTQLVTDLNAARDSDLQDAERQRITLELKLERSMADRAQQLEDLKRTLLAEHGKADALGRNLAATLANHDTLSSLVEQRDATIAAQAQECDGLRAQLQAMQLETERLAREIESARQRVADDDVRAADLAARDARIDELSSHLDAMAQQQAAAVHAHQETQRALHDALSQSVRDDEQHQALATELHETRAVAQSLADQRDQLQAQLAEQSSRSQELDALRAELETVRSDGVAVWAELEVQSKLAVSRSQELDAARQAATDLERERDELRRALHEAQHNVERLVAVSSDDTDLLNERTAQLAAARNELDAQQSAVRGMEHALRARDTLIDDLRAEIRTAQDERAIVAEQLSKVRSRVKNMAQQIFNRDNRIAVLKADLAVHTEALAAIRRDVDSIDPEAAVPDEPPQRVLEPVNHEGEPIVLDRRVMTIGRTNDNDIFIPSKMISRHHARLLVGPNAVIVEDAGSTNGCFVNEQQVKQHVLHEGDELTIGDLKFRLAIRTRNHDQDSAR